MLVLSRFRTISAAGRAFRKHRSRLPEKICVKTASYWFDSANRPKFRPLARRLSVDVLIVSGGVTGILAAYLLQKQDRGWRCWNAGGISTRDTGHTTAHLTRRTEGTESDRSAAPAVRDHANATWHAGAAAIE